MENNNLINPNFSEIGYIQIYTGNGKGKTTASLGLALRALGRGWRVLIVFFTKGGDDYGELFALRELSPKLKKQLTIVQAGLDRIVYSNNQNEDDKKAVREGWEIVKQAAVSKEYQLIIMDEANIAIDLNLITVEEMKEFLSNKPKALEIVLTGRRANEEITELAHLVSNIDPVKHYWDIGIHARKGIEY
ncbi:MAG: cob(I)yrinic acid a,c-diamide adenosyltransferase [Candidatus Gastranaerophilales bacterium]|nr:cob(I)yrinic acid a,c-diamide adenosyltransferase [Candidatus Gastranaerophilales bacterium]